MTWKDILKYEFDFDSYDDYEEFSRDRGTITVREGNVSIEYQDYGGGEFGIVEGTKTDNLPPKLKQWFSETGPNADYEDFDIAEDRGLIVE